MLCCCGIMLSSARRHARAVIMVCPLLAWCTLGAVGARRCNSVIHTPASTSMSTTGVCAVASSHGAPCPTMCINSIPGELLKACESAWAHIQTKTCWVLLLMYNSQRLQTVGTRQQVTAQPMLPHPAPSPRAMRPSGAAAAEELQQNMYSAAARNKVHAHVWRNALLNTTEQLCGRALLHGHGHGRVSSYATECGRQGRQSGMAYNGAGASLARGRHGVLGAGGAHRRAWRDYTTSPVQVHHQIK